MDLFVAYDDVAYCVINVVFNYFLIYQSYYIKGIRYVHEVKWFMLNIFFKGTYL